MIESNAIYVNAAVRTTKWYIFMNKRNPRNKNYLEWVMCSAVLFFSFRFVLSKKKLFRSKIYDIIIKLIQSSFVFVRITYANYEIVLEVVLYIYKC